MQKRKILVYNKEKRIKYHKIYKKDLKKPIIFKIVVDFGKKVLYNL